MTNLQSIIRENLFGKSGLDGLVDDLYQLTKAQNDGNPTAWALAESKALEIARLCASSQQDITTSQQQVRR